MHPVHGEIMASIKTIVENLGRGDADLVLESISMIGSKINHIMEENVEGISLADLNNILFDAYVLMQDIPSRLPEDEKHHDAFITSKALEYFILNNYVYTSVGEGQSLTALAYTLSSLLARMVSPLQLLPLEHLQEFSDQKLNLAYRLYNGYSHIYLSVLSKAIAINRSDLQIWIRDFYRTAPYIWSIIEELWRRQKEVQSPEFFDKAVSSAINYISFSLMVLALMKSSTNWQLKLEERDLFDQFERWISLLKALKEGHSGVNDFRSRLNQIGAAYAEFLVELSLAASKPEFPSNFESRRLISLYRQVKMQFSPQRIFETPYAPIATDLAVKGLSLLSLKSGLSEEDGAFVEEIQGDAPQGSFEIGMALILLHLKFPSLSRKSLEELKQKLGWKTQNNPINQLTIQLLLGLLGNEQNFESLIDYVKVKLPSLLTQVQTIVKEGGSEQPIKFNPYDSWTWLVPKLPNGRYWYPFNCISNLKVV